MAGTFRPPELSASASRCATMPPLTICRASLQQHPKPCVRALLYRKGTERPPRPRAGRVRCTGEDGDMAARCSVRCGLRQEGERPPSSQNAAPARDTDSASGSAPQSRNQRAERLSRGCLRLAAWPPHPPRGAGEAAAR